MRHDKMEYFANSAVKEEEVDGGMVVQLAGNIVVALQTVRCVALDWTILEDQKAICVKLTDQAGQLVQEFQIYGRLLELFDQMMGMVRSPELLSVIMAIPAIYYTFKGGQALLNRMRGN